MTETQTTPGYDTRSGFEKALKDGLSGLQVIAAARHKAGYERKERLGTWIILGYFYFDSTGNTMVITECRPDYHTFDKTLPRVLTKKELQGGKQHGWMSMTMGSIPPTDAVCPRCLEGWDLRNVDTHKSVRDSKTDKWEHYHKRCHALMVLQREVIFFEGILDDSEIHYTEMRLIPAEYPDRPTAPWFMIETEKGPIKIGYRRRVISISWEHSDLGVNGDELFKEEGVTTGRTLVHAWGKEKAVEYLQKLLDHGG